MSFCFPNKPVRTYSPAQFAETIDLDAWVVQPKWNGHRALPACDLDGNITVYNRKGTTLALAKSDWQWLSMLNLPRPWALDAELLRDGRMIAWDFSMLGGVLRIRDPYADRLAELQALVPGQLNKDKFSFSIIETLPAKKFRNFMLRQRDKELEGFVFKLATATNLWGIYSTADVGSQIKYRF